MGPHPPLPWPLYRAGYQEQLSCGYIPEPRATPEKAKEVAANGTILLGDFEAHGGAG